MPIKYESWIFYILGVKKDVWAGIKISGIVNILIVFKAMRLDDELLSKE